jgi:glycosyltransferase involved in cell wall biosynthesis
VLDYFQELGKPSDIPTFSIITVSWNAEQTIRKTIESVINQTERDFEYIIIDGASTDNTMKIVTEYSNKITRILCEKDKGIQDAYNKGINLASGRYIGILNADDQYNLNTLEIVRKEIDKLEDPETIIYGGMSFTDNSEDYLFVSHVELGKRMICHPTCFIPASIHRRFGNYDLKYSIASDYDLLSRLSSFGVSFLGINKPLVIYKPGGISSQKKLTSIKDTLRIQKKYNNWNFLEYSYESARLLAALFIKRSNDIFVMYRK